MPTLRWLLNPRPTRGVGAIFHAEASRSQRTGRRWSTRPPPTLRDLCRGLTTEHQGARPQIPLLGRGRRGAAPPPPPPSQLRRRPHVTRALSRDSSGASTVTAGDSLICAFVGPQALSVGDYQLKLYAELKMAYQPEVTWALRVTARRPSGEAGQSSHGADDRVAYWSGSDEVECADPAIDEESGIAKHAAPQRHRAAQAWNAAPTLPRRMRGVLLDGASRTVRAEDAPSDGHLGWTELSRVEVGCAINASTSASPTQWCTAGGTAAPCGRSTWPRAAAYSSTIADISLDHPALALGVSNVVVVDADTRSAVGNLSAIELRFDADLEPLDANASDYVDVNGTLHDTSLYDDSLAPLERFAPRSC